MTLLQRLKAWGAVEKNGRRLHLINISINLVFIVGFGLLDMLLSRLQHGNLVPVQRVACALQWVNVVTVHLMPEHIRRYVEQHCATSEISTQTIVRIYIMFKITIAILISIAATLIYTTLIFSGDKLYTKYAYSDIKHFSFDVKFVNSSKKLLIKILFFTTPGISILIYGSFYMVFSLDGLEHIDFPINFASTCGLWFCIGFPSFAIVRPTYLAIRLMSGDEPREQ